MIMIFALLAPELVTTWALRQYIGATQHMVEYNHTFHSGGEQQIETWSNSILFLFSNASGQIYSAIDQIKSTIHHKTRLDQFCNL